MNADRGTADGGDAAPLGISIQLLFEKRPWVLRRLDAVTLAVEAEREFRGERSVLMWVGE